MKGGWPLIPLGEVLTERRETPEASALDSGEIPIVAKVGFNDGRIQLRIGGDTKTGMILIRPGDVVVSGINAAKGAIALYGEDNARPIAATIHYGAYIPDKSRVDVSYLWWLLRSGTFRDLLQEYVPGGIKTELKAKRFLPIPIPLPPLSDQCRIIGRIEELAAKIEEAKGLRRYCDETAEVIFSSAMNRIWSSVGSWKSEALGQIANTVSGQIDPKVEPYCNLPHINGENIQSGTCRLLQYNLAKEDGVISGKYHFRPGTILYSKLRPYLRKAVQVPVEGICSADIYAFDTISQSLLPRFFMYSLISPHFTEYANLLSGRTRMPKLNQDQLFAYQLNYPNIDEQDRIVAYLDGLQAKVDALKAMQSETDKELAALLPSVLDRAFSGRL